MSPGSAAILLLLVAALSFAVGVWYGGNLGFVRPQSSSPTVEAAVAEPSKSAPAAVRPVALVNGRRWSALEV
ncbi:MAG: hypothetical protein QF921_01020 [Pseudomonadales bacterium]|nr:hypothetical protein [Pseudomonadales bacterium]MDP6826454.1 hypothetical protein [Pseudomonadales bacterium]MDP6970091.1 hypothetical protein [Pseudomonadales bacterium]|tara:strand:- start:176 stop:391 length:216 start_codon:yes stop_codon:yes gene_type:complete